MLNHNRAPKVVAVFAGAGLALSACVTGDQAPPILLPTEAASAPPETFPSDAAHSADCTGKISGWRDLTYTKDGEEYQITDIAGGTCAAIYDNMTPQRKLLGSVSVGTGITAPCAIGSEHTYARVFASSVHQENGGFTSGTDFVGDVAVTPGAGWPLPDCGEVPANGYTHPA